MTENKQGKEARRAVSSTAHWGQHLNNLCPRISEPTASQLLTPCHSPFLPIRERREGGMEGNFFWRGGGAVLEASVSE